MTWQRFQQYFIRAGHVADTKLACAKLHAPKQHDDKKKGEKSKGEAKGGAKEKRKVTQAPGSPRANQGLPLPANILAISPSERLSTARSTGACLNCLSTAHKTFQCDRVRADGTLWVTERVGRRDTGVAGPTQ